MKRIICVLNDHPESGNTTFAACLAATLRRQGHRAAFLSIVGDEEDSRDEGVPYDASWNIIEDNKINRLLDWTESHDVVICDVESGYGDAFVELHESEDLELVLGEMDTELTVVMPQVDEAECNEAIQEVASALTDKVYYVIPRTPVDEFRSHLEAWEDSEAIATLDYHGAVVLDMPRVTDSLQQLLEDEEMSIIDAVFSETETLPDSLSEHVAFWLKELDHQLEDAFDYFLPDVESKHGFKRTA